MSLSKKKFSGLEESKYFYFEDDVKEAIKELKKKCYEDLEFNYGAMVVYIDEIFGEELVK